MKARMKFIDMQIMLTFYIVAFFGWRLNFFTAVGMHCISCNTKHLLHWIGRLREWCCWSGLVLIGDLVKTKGKFLMKFIYFFWQSFLNKSFLKNTFSAESNGDFILMVTLTNETIRFNSIPVLLQLLFWFVLSKIYEFSICNTTYLR